jgi:hypothetical protein
MVSAREGLWGDRATVRGNRVVIFHLAKPFEGPRESDVRGAAGTETRFHFRTDITSGHGSRVRTEKWFETRFRSRARAGPSVSVPPPKMGTGRSQYGCCSRCARPSVLVASSYRRINRQED